MFDYPSRHSLVFQLVSRIIGALFLCLAIAFIGLYWTIVQVIDRDLDVDMREDIAEFKVIFEQGGDSAVISEMARETPDGESQLVFLRLFSDDSTEIHSTDLRYWGTLDLSSELVHQLGEGDPPDLRTISIERQGIKARVVTGRLGPDRVMQIGESMQARNEIMEVIMVALAFVFLLALPLAGFLGWMVTRQATDSIKRVSIAARDIQEGKLSSRVIIGNESSEIYTLGNSFNSMADRIDNLIMDMREMTDNIAQICAALSAEFVQLQKLPSRVISPVKVIVVQPSPVLQRVTA